MSDLRATQEAMRSALHDGEPDRLLTMVAPGAVLAPAFATETRVEVYRTMYLVRLAEALAGDFPLVRRLLGEALFDRVAVTHVKRHPSSHPSLAFLGRHFDETLTHLGQDVEAAVARLEWARVEAFWSPHGECATAELLGALGARLGDAVLSFHPSVRLIRLPGFVRSIAAGGAVEATDPTGEDSWVVWRRGNVVDERIVTPVESRALAGALAGERVSEVCEVFLEAAAPEAAAVEALVRWVRDGWIGAQP